MCFCTRPSKDTPDPKPSPPALHNARYDGWPSPPLQLPNFSSPSFKKHAERRTAFAIDAPSNRRPRCPTCGSLSQPLLEHHPIHPHCDTHPRANSGVQDIMCPVESRRRNISNSCSCLCMSCNSGTRQNQSLQGVYLENAVIKHDPAQRADNSMPLINKDTQISYLLAAAPWMPLVYDLRYPPSSLQFHPFSKHAGAGYGLLRIPLAAGSKQIRLISQDFPWEFNIKPRFGEQEITCLYVLNILHAALQIPLSFTELGTAGEDKHASIVEARDRRMTMGPAWRGRLNSKASTTAQSRARLEHDAGMALGKQQPMILRVDWLGIRVAFGGLVKDEAFAKSRLIPGASDPPETWVVKFQRLPVLLLE